MHAPSMTGEYVGGPLDGERIADARRYFGEAGSRVVIVWLWRPPATYVVHDDPSGFRLRYMSSSLGGA